jgi:pyruvate formate lyase activating enzyme
MLATPATPAATLARARQQAKEAGIHHVYTGNVSDKSGQSTYCGNCRRLLIERNWYNLGEWNLDPEGGCRYCDTPLAGHFTAAADDWGARRQHVLIKGR